MNTTKLCTYKPLGNSGILRLFNKQAGRAFIVAFAIISMVSVPSTYAISSVTTPLPTDIVGTPYGSIGKWMLQSNGQIANYGGQLYQGKALLEPVNVIVVDPTSKSTLESIIKVGLSMSKAGFPGRLGHSTGFKGLINGTVYNQRPGGLIRAFSDNSFLSQNNHGRLFGPASVAGGGYVYSGAFSTEKFIIYNWLPAHVYVSSNMARDAVAAKLKATGQVQSVSIDMSNTYNTPMTGTGDHDGKAVVIVLK